MCSCWYTERITEERGHRLKVIQCWWSGSLPQPHKLLSVCHEVCYPPAQWVQHCQLRCDSSFSVTQSHAALQLHATLSQQILNSNLACLSYRTNSLHSLTMVLFLFSHSHLFLLSWFLLLFYFFFFLLSLTYCVSYPSVSPSVSILRHINSTDTINTLVTVQNITRSMYKHKNLEIFYLRHRGRHHLQCVVAKQVADIPATPCLNKTGKWWHKLVSEEVTLLWAHTDTK